MENIYIFAGLLTAFLAVFFFFCRRVLSSFENPGPQAQQTDSSSDKTRDEWIIKNVIGKMAG